MRFFLSCAWRLYACWSNFCNLFESVFFLDNDGLLRKYTDPEYENLQHGTAWKSFTVDYLSLVHNGGDKWYMGIDVISTPVRFVNRKKGDCDDFARLGRHFFGEFVSRRTVAKDKECMYRFDGLYCIKTKKAGHCVAVWKTYSSVCPRYFVVDNFHVFTIADDAQFLRRYTDLMGNIEAIGVLSLKENESLKYEKTISVVGDRMRRDT